MDARARTITDPAALEVLANPIRRQILEALREPDSAANVGRLMDLPRQKVNYHLKELARVELVRPVGERRKGHLIEKLYQAVAGTFVLSPRTAWDDDRRARALQDQVSLSRLVHVGEQLQQDAVALLDRAAYDGEQIPSASVEAEISFADEEARGAFLHEYLAMLGPLIDKYGSRNGAPFKIVLATYPNPED